MDACVVCKVTCEKKCSLCCTVYYCSREHQKQDWKRHKLQCVPYRLKETPLLGRHLVASRRINAGEQVLREAPLVSGPLQTTPPVCLGCYKLLSQLTCIECEKCGWPMCSVQCARSPQHKPECTISTKWRSGKVKIQHYQMVHPSYECVTVLRCLWMKTYLPSTWEKLNNLQSHCEERKLTEKYQQDRQYVAQFIHRYFKFTEFTEEEILRVSGIININGHEVPISGHDYVSIYNTASYLEHNCQANCSKSFSSSGELVIRAARTIEADEHLSICYSDPLWGTSSRREYLQQTKFFSCDCRRCSSPTELNTHFSSLLCTSGNCKGSIVPTDPLNSCNWHCLNCNSAMTQEEVNAVVSHASEVLSSTDKLNLEDCIRFVDTFERILHPHHYLITEGKLAITQCLDSGVETLSEQQLTMKMRYCKQLHQLTTHFVPAENRCIGVLLFGIHAALAETGRRKSNRGEMDAADLKNNLLECKSILLEAYRLLKHEPDVLPEGQIAHQARVNLQDIERILQSLHANTGDNVL